jgi:hypothetical protein
MRAFELKPGESEVVLAPVVDELIADTATGL